MRGELGLDPRQLLEGVIRPTLVGLKLGGTVAERLVLGTGMVESRLKYLHQLGDGPALGIFQDEPGDHDDIWKNWLSYQFPIQAAIRSFMTTQSKLDQLVTNLAYATAICRCHYRRVTQALPGPSDAVGMARYHKDHYNTVLGATDVNESVEWFKLAIEIGS